MQARSRPIVTLVIGVFLAGGAGTPVAAAATSANSASSGWRLVQKFRQCGAGQISDMATTGPRNSWAIGQWVPCGGHPLEPLISHWDGRKWSVVTPPSPVELQLTAAGNAVAALDASSAWMFMKGDSESFASLWSSGRWRRTYRLAPGSSVVSAVAFSQSNAWALGSVDVNEQAVPYGVRFNGTGWRRVALPVLPVAAAEPAPQNIWVVGTVGNPNVQHFALAHWTGHWQTVPFPDLGLPSWETAVPASVVWDNSNGAWVSGFLEGHGSSFLGGVLLHWTGTRWRRVTVPFHSLGFGPLAHDGHNGLWITSNPGVLCDPCNNVDMLHRNGSGGWSKMRVRAWNADVRSIRRVPGSTRLWAGGFNFQGPGFAESHPIIIKYDP